MQAVALYPFGSTHNSKIAVKNFTAIHNASSFPLFSAKKDKPPKAENSMPLAKKAFFGSALLSNIAVGIGGAFFPPLWAAYSITLPLTALGLYDSIQTKHPLRHNYPAFSRLRWIAEMFRPEVRQYFIEDDLNGRPFSRDQRETVYKRAKLDNDTIAYGTKRDLYEIGVESVAHSMAATKPCKEDIRVVIGGTDCKQRYSASIFNISAMSHGALGGNAILALNKGAKLGNFFHNTGEGSISPYHLGQDLDIEDPEFNYEEFIEKMRNPSDEMMKNMTDLCWQVGTGYFGCRDADGNFDPARFKALATLPQVKMIELKISQGAKPGHGGILPAVKLTPGIAKIRKVPLGMDVISPPTHSTFSTPKEMLFFIKKLRELSEGKPIGFKLCIGNKHEFLAICKAMVETGISPDFITIDGAEGGTGAAPREFADSVGMSLDDALVFVQNALVGMGLREEIKIICSGKIINAIDIITKIARGANIANSARGELMSLGCIQALKCNTGNCPIGIATNNESLVKALDPKEKSIQVFNFTHQTVKNLKEILAAMGLKHTLEIRPWHVQKRVSISEIKNLSQVYEFVEPGAFLEGNIPDSLINEYNHADPDTFLSSKNGKNWKPPQKPSL